MSSALDLSANKRRLLERLLRKEGLSGQEMMAIPRRSPDAAIPLSFAQQRLWFLDQLDPGNVAYNLSRGLRLTGALNVAALGQSLNVIVARHEVLRTTFAAQDGQPVQIIAPTLTVPIEQISLVDLPPVAQEAEVQRLINADLLLPFDLATGPLIRAKLLRLAADEHVFFLTNHHIVSDALSMGVMIQEFTAAYQSFSAGQALALTELPIQYADFSVWQRHELQGQNQARQIDYWRQQLAGLEPLDLRTDYPRPTVANLDGAITAVHIDPALADHLRALSRANNATLFMTLLAAWQVLLSRYSNQHDIAVGTPIAGRSRPELERLIGFFVNTLVLRADLNDNPTVNELLQRVRATTLAAYAHQDVPFEAVVEAVQPERDLSRSPLFQVMFSLQTETRATLDLPGLTVQPLAVEGTSAKFDLTLTVSESESGLHAAIQYRSDLFAAATIERMAAHFQMVLAAFVANADQRIGELTLLTHAERQQVLYAWNATTVSYAPDQGVHRLVEAQAAHNPGALALITETQRLTYADLNARANQIAHYLRQRGVGPDVCVGLYLPRSQDFVIAALAVLKAGGAYLPLDSGYPAARLEFMLRDARARVLLTHSSLSVALAVDGLAVVLLDRDAAQIDQQPAANPDLAVALDQLAYVIYTSGSTGTPKGVEIPHRGLLNLLRWHQATYALTPADRASLLAGLAFDASVWELWPYLTCGASLVIPPEEVRITAEGLTAWLAAMEVTIAFLPTPLAEAALPQLRQTTLPLRALLTGGDLLHAYDWATLPFRVINHYGPTENSVVTTAATEPAAPGLLPPIGRPIANTQVYLLDAQGQPVPVGVPGELYVGGAQLARGYLNRPDLTADRFVPDPFSATPGGRLYRTADLARWLPDGQIEFLGRIDQQVKLRGFRIEIGEIEAVLQQHPDVGECVVVVREDVPGGKRLVAYVIENKEQRIETRDSEDGSRFAGCPCPEGTRIAPVVGSSQELRQFLAARLPEYMIPSAFVALDTLPLTPNGKVDRRALPAPDVDADERAVYVAPSTTVEVALAQIWAEVLHVEGVGIHDNFFDLGGHSLLATQVVSRVRTALNVELPVRVIFEHPTIAGLAQVVAQQQTTAQLPPLRPRGTSESVPLSFAQQRLWFIEQLQPGTASYHVPAALTIRGSLDVAALEASLAAVVARHESLRTRFVLVDETPMQVVVPELDLPVTLIDLSHLSGDAQRAEVMRLARIEAITPFDLTTGPLLRITLLHCAADEHVLLLTQHHIITDGWSLGILIQDLTAAYLRYRQGQPHPEGTPLPPLPIQYPDYALWQRAYLQGTVLEQQLGYWRQQLAGLAPLDLPTDRPRPPVQSHRGSTMPIVLDSRLAEQLHALSRSSGTSLFMTLLAAWQVLLSRYSGHNDIAVGTPIAGRTQPELEQLIGFFVNTLVLRADLSDNPSFAELLQRVRTTTLAAYAHQDVPFEAVVEAVQPERDLSRSPLFQVMFSLMNAPLPEVTLPDIQIAPLHVSSATAMFDLSITLLDLPTGISGRVEYATDLFDEATIRRLLEQYQILLAGVVADPNQSIATLPLLTEAERRQLLVWGGPELDYAHDRCFHTLVAEQAARTPDALAVVFEDQHLTYRQLDQRANQLAHQLQLLGVGPEVPVVLWLDRSLEQIVALLGILKAGGAYVPLDPSFPTDRVAFVLQDTQAALLLTSSALRPRLSDLNSHVIEIDSIQAQLATLPTSDPASPVLPENMAYIIYTSGSTGLPKGVMVPHRTIQNLATGLMQRIYDQILLRDTPLRVSVNAPLAFDASMQQLLTLMTGHTLYLVSSAVRSDVTALLTFLQTQQIDVFDCVPSQLRLLLEAGLLSSGGPAPQVILAGGEAIDLATWQVLAETTQTDVYNIYGPTECTVDTVVARIRNYPALPVIGQPLANTDAYVLDANLELVPVGVPGELYLGGASVTRGYFGRPRLTAERFVPDPFGSGPAGRLYRTGDRVRYRADGTIEFLGRMDYQVKLRGYRIELGEIESSLLQQDVVREAVVVLHEDRSAGYVDQRLVAYVVVDHTAQSDDSAALESQLRSALGARMPEYMVPSVFMALDALPLTSSGKINRRALPAPSQARSELAPPYVAPRTPDEEALAKIWAELLRVERVGINDNFFALGGHSLLAFRLMEQIRKSFGRALPLATIFERPTIEQLVLRLAQDQFMGWSPLVPIQPLGSKPPLFCVHGLGGTVLNFADLGRALAPDQPLYALQARGIDADQEPHSKIEEMATAYIEAIRLIQPQGPYFLSGWSLGCTIAFEMAQQLRAAGENVALLALLDSPLIHTDETAAPLDDSAVLGQMAQTYGLRLDDPGILRKLGIEAGVAYLHDQARIQDPAGWGSIPLPVLQRMAQVGIVQVRAVYGYVPQSYGGRISLFSATDTVPDRAQEHAESMRASWLPYADEGVDLMLTPGTHWTMLSQPAVQTLALHLLCLLQKAQEGNLEAYPAVVD